MEKQRALLEETGWIDVKKFKEKKRKEKEDEETEDETDNIFEREEEEDDEDSAFENDRIVTRKYQQEDEETEEPKVWTCWWDTCRETFDTKKQVIDHQNEMHLKDKHYSCNHCGKEFDRARKVISHARTCSKNPVNQGKPSRTILKEEEQRIKRAKGRRSYFISKQKI